MAEMNKKKKEKKKQKIHKERIVAAEAE